MNVDTDSIFNWRILENEEAAINNAEGQRMHFTLNKRMFVWTVRLKMGLKEINVILSLKNYKQNNKQSNIISEPNPWNI